MKKIKKKKFVKKSSTSKPKEERHSDWISGKILPTPKKVAAAIDKINVDELDEEIVNVSAEHPSPNDGKTFKRKWNQFIPILMERKNFHMTVLSQLEVLCSLYVEYEELSKFILENGYTYEAFGRQGKAVKPFPQVAQFNKVKADIAAYTKMLELNVAKMKTVKKDDETEWK